jgi:hypothetical protein
MDGMNLGDQFEFDINRDCIACRDCHARGTSVAGIKHQQWCPTWNAKTIPVVMTDYRTYSTKVYDPELQKSIDEYRRT